MCFSTSNPEQQYSNRSCPRNQNWGDKTKRNMKQKYIVWSGIVYQMFQRYHDRMTGKRQLTPALEVPVKLQVKVSQLRKNKDRIVGWRTTTTLTQKTKQKKKTVQRQPLKHNQTLSLEYEPAVLSRPLGLLLWLAQRSGPDGLTLAVNNVIWKDKNTTGTSWFPS